MWGETEFFSHNGNLKTEFLSPLSIDKLYLHVLNQPFKRAKLMIYTIIAALLFVLGIGLLGAALFGRLRQRRILLLVVTVVLWGIAACSSQEGDVQTTTPTETPAPVAEQILPPEPTAEPAIEPTATTALSPLPDPTQPAAPEPELGQLVFPSERGGSFDIWVMHLIDPENPVQLTTSPGLDVEPMWSPDGSKILFLSTRDNPDNIHELYVMNADGSAQQRLLEWPESYEWGATWSPDGEKIAFTTTRDFNYELYVMNADGSGEPINITQNEGLDTYPHWSPDGQWLVFVSDRGGNWDIWKMDVQACLAALEAEEASGEACEAIQLTADNPDDDFYPRWSPDGSQIAFESRREANRDIYIMDADGGNVTRVTTELVHDSNPMWALDGTALIFSSERDFDWDLFIINVDGTDERRLTDVTGEDRFGDWMP